MSYADFAVSRLVKQFSLSIDEKTNLYDGVNALALRPEFQWQLERTSALALMLSTEKARSEFIIAPILTELWQICGERFGLFSGVDFPVDPESGLVGVCDYIVTRSPELLYVSAPVLLLVEAKNEDMRRGYGQCIAEMVAAQRYNDHDGTPTPKIYGAVTIGERWKFLEIEASTVRVDAVDYYLKDIGKIVGILQMMATG
jgi:hypothetical protein